METLEKSVYSTLSYSDVFNFPLTQSEIHHRIISSQRITKKQVSQALENLVAKKKISSQTGFYFLPNRQNLVSKRLSKVAISEQKIKFAQKYADIILDLPFVEAIFLTGAVACQNATSEDDIDFMIVTSPNSLWTARFLVNLKLEALRVRRHPKSENPANTICPNIFISRGSLLIPSKLQNLYSAYEIVQAKPLRDPNNLYHQFIIENSWIKSYLKNGFLTLSKSNSQNQSLEHKSPLLIEMFLHFIQYLYMLPKKTIETITPNQAFFHPQNTAILVLKELAHRMKRY